jgi:hypothetical protein
LKARGDFAVEAPFGGRIRRLLLLVLVCGLFYGAVMGTYSGLGPGRQAQILFSALKVPFLLLVTFLLCLPSFFVLNVVAGLRDDFGEALRAVIATQACITVVLAAMAPLTAFFYLSCTSYSQAVFINGFMFAAASASAQIVVRRYYGPLVRRSPRHRHLRFAWFILYIFVGIQMGWVLRPFIGSPGMDPTFIRREAWGNAYVVVAQVVRSALLGTG